MLELRTISAATLLFMVFLMRIAVGCAKSTNFLERQQIEIDGEDGRKAQLKTNAGELDVLPDPFELAATRIRVSVQQLGPSDITEKNTPKSDSDLIADLSVPTTTLRPANSTSIKHRPSPTSAELVDPSIDEYSEDPFDGSGGGARLPAFSLKP